MITRNIGLGIALAASLFSAACSSSDSSGKGSSASTAAGANGNNGSVTGDPNNGTQAAKFFLPTGEPTNTSAPVIEIDKQGGIHAIYPQYVRGGAFYAYCPASCTGPDQMKVVPFETDGTVANAMLALDNDGVPHVLLSSALRLYYAQPSGDATDPASWKTSVILDHGGEREVSGEAFALDPAGHPRFIMHVYKAYLGVGQKTPATYFVSCDAANCNEDPASWSQGKISDQIWRGSSLRFDTNGAAHLATVMPLDKNAGANESSGVETGAYMKCASDCGKEASWNGIGLLPIFESEIEAVRVKPSISLALTKSGAPRIVELGKKDDKRAVAYFQCDAADCVQDNWTATIISDSDKLGDGVDLALDVNDHPRFVYTINYNIGLYSCDDPANCATAESKWELAKVELGNEMKPDEIFLYENCTVSAWFLHSPSIALDAAGHARVGYQARDISGGFKNPSPSTKSDCVAGTDMTWSRLALMPSVK